VRRVAYVALRVAGILQTGSLLENRKPVAPKDTRSSATTLQDWPKTGEASRELKRHATRATNSATVLSTTSATAARSATTRATKTPRGP
jgi:hypothetical protein